MSDEETLAKKVGSRRVVNLPLANDHALAASLAEAAGRLLLDLRGELADADPALLRAEGDRRSQDFIRDVLRVARPLDGVLSEEAPDDPSRLAADRVWIVDPLDGTREFGEGGRTDWAVHVALVCRGRVACAAVALPALDTVLSTQDPSRDRGRRPGQLRVVTSRTRPPAITVPLAQRLDAEVLGMGSAGAKAGAVVTGLADVYVHAGGQYEWDVAAPAGVAVAAGLHASRLDGSPLRFNQRNPWSPDLLICRPELAEPVLSALRALR
jgi:3'(2'), 5'-bisphosphate nucleotidase